MPNSLTLNRNFHLLSHSNNLQLTVQSVTPNYREPWRRNTQDSWSGTGFVVAGRRLVTNAHVVQNSSHVRARKSSSPIMFSCTVEWISIPLDLALLSVNNEDAFFSSDTMSDGAAAANGTDTTATATTSSSNGSASASANGGDAESHLSLCHTLPTLDDNVTCVGFPEGGSQISVTRGVVSRVDVGSNGVLRIQIDAAINPGNSGGPVFNESGGVVGVAMSHLKSASNIGYIIPTSVLSNFLDMCTHGVEATPAERSSLNVIDEPCGGMKEAAAGDAVGIEGPKMVPGIVAVDAYTQTLESNALRRRLGLDDDGIGGGVRVSGLWYSTPRLPFEGVEPAQTMESRENDGSSVCRDDVLLKVDGIEVGQDGTVPLSSVRPDERISKSHLFTRRRVGHVLDIEVLRDGKPVTLRHKLTPLRYLCPVHDQFDAHPSYVVCGGCIFVPMSWPWISAHKYSDGWESGFPSFNAISSLPAQGSKQIIVLSGVLADEVNVGFHNKKWLILKSFNGEKPTNIRDLVRRIATCKDKYLEFRLHAVNQEDYNEQLICLEMDDVKKAEERILKQHMIASFCSEDAIPPEYKNGDDAKTMVELLERAASASAGKE